MSGDEFVYSQMVSLKFKNIFWFIPIFLTVHNIEEAIIMPDWLWAHLPLLQTSVPIFDHLQFSTSQIYVSLSLVTIIPWGITIWCMQGDLSDGKRNVLLALQSIIFWNAIMPHMSGVFILQIYNPGTITAIAINFPFSLYLFYHSVMDQLVSQRSMVKILVVGLSIYLPLVYLNHLIAKQIAIFF